MPLSDHEQRMLDQIESALYAEDPKFVSSVRGSRLRRASSRRRLQAIALFAVGLVLLVAGITLPVKLGDFPVISLIGFIVMFGAGVLLLGGRAKSAPDSPASPPRRSGSFSARMEDRFRRRFEQE
ncbi:DUF3040 domain-containing protein [Skermania piniformis]|uniref:DUF3040 domain-containing protein n=1 Tax=Skermania pinensis TaxID=39122 RepID=A0ABX8SBC9_9ACTN|nr:DUF3040 domain-containing protein [Skermania piniformis]QXQ15088.1 DUF3040 domain-containing protein [Skermania piniformis]